ncbi:MAG: LacI family transcriptional regulator [Eubacteriales bacterium]|nr:LacI family transcriptional regulator [Eubacteriales bacterium]
MKEIAELAGVSVATVSYVLSGKKKVSPAKRERVLNAVELTNYKLNTIAKSLRTSKTEIIGVLVEDICGLPVPEIVDGINQMLSDSGYQVLLNNLQLLNKLYNQYEQLSQYISTINRGIQLLEDARVDGIIYIAMHDRRIDGIHQPVNIPLVFAYANSDDPASLSVSYDNHFSSYDITQHLIQLNHKRIALIAGHTNSSATKLRLSGFRAAMNEAGLHVPQEYIRWGDWEFHSGLEQTNMLLSLKIPPTAIVAMNDVMAAGCYAAAYKRKLSIPEDLSVVGFDNQPVASFLYPNLTTVALPNKKIGLTAAKHLLWRLEGREKIPANTTLPCTVIVRDSTAPPK